MSPRSRRAKMYMREEAEGRVPFTVKSIALQAVRLMINLDKYPISSRMVERDVHALLGMVGYLKRMCDVVWREEGLKRYAEYQLRREAEKSVV